MKALRPLANGIVVAVLLFGAGLAPVWADSARLDRLFAQLQSANEADAATITQDIWIEWSKSGSAAMDFLLQRGKAALAAGDAQSAIDHFSALIDHAPDFAEGYNARATAYYQIGQLGLSLADVDKTLALNPRHFGAMSGFAMILEDLGRPEQALEVHQAVKAIHPNAAGVSEAIDRLTADLQGSSL